MPPIAAAGAAVASSLAAVGTAAIGALSAVGIAEGLVIAGTGLGLIGQATGNKTLSKIGLGFTMAGGITGLAKNVSAKNAATTAISGDTAKTTRLLDVDNIENSLAETTKGAKTMGDLQTFKPAGIMSESTDAFKNGANSINFNPSSVTGAASLDEPSFLQRAGLTLRKYDTAANVLMGMGNAYMQTRGIQAQEDMLGDRLDFEQKQIDRQTKNYGAPSTGYAAPGIKRVPGIVNTDGLLRVR